MRLIQVSIQQKMDRFNSIFTKTFASSKKAIAYCQNLARLCGFSVRIRTSKTTTIYIVCSREGLPEPNREMKKRTRNSERCSCDWRIVLFRRSFDQWEFRNGKTMEHNHVILSSEAFLDAEDKLPVHQHMSPPSHGSSSPLPSFRSLDLPVSCIAGSITPTYESCPINEKPKFIQLPPLTNCLTRIMDRSTPYSRPHSLAYLLN
ncbi:hypothetical protein DSO57_1029495 [Entomophthora muscae]|uniref:Uncharacterized protein n=1 Tax=Entomophthora muscae TaxID=34485 RepID=A0ACC2UM50_9FUNG|nr:hypothetical protein DSO57_1029495 [Entomophthora muscae]